MKRTFGQFVELYRGMSPSQRGTLLAVPLVVALGFALVLLTGTTKSYQALSWGKALTTEELINAEQTLIQAGLNDFRREGQRIVVPSGEADRYNAALVANGTLPSDSVSEWEKQFEKSNSFTSRSQLEQLKEIALRKELRRVLGAVPAIEDASVIWARTEDHSPFRQKPKVTATVNVRPRSGRELSLTLIHSLRIAVANMIPDLSSEDVTVFDQSTGTSFAAGKDGDPFNSRLLAKIKQFEQAEYEKINHALSPIENVLVTVSVDMDNLQHHVETSHTYDKTLDIQTSRTMKDSQSTQARPSAEPGVNSNSPRNLTLQNGKSPSETITEEKTDTSSIPSSITESEKVYSEAMPKAVRVTVSVPDDYYRAIALKQGVEEGTTDQEKAAFQKSLADIEQQELAKVEATVRTLLPKDSPTESINVRTYVRLPDKETIPQVSWFDTMAGLLSRWGSAVGLGLFALWSLWMLNKSLAKVPAEDVPSPIPELTGALSEKKEESSSDSQTEQISKRDQLQMTVRDNPELAVAVLSKWIRAAAK